MKQLVKRKAILTKDGGGKNTLADMRRRVNESLAIGFLHRIRSGIYLGVIKEDKLYIEGGWKSFNEFVEGTQFATETGIMTAKEAHVRIAQAELVEAIRASIAASGMAIDEPTSAYQLLPFLKYPPLKAAPLYVKAVMELKNSESPVTGTNLAEWTKNRGTDIEVTVTPVSSGDFVSQEDDEPEIIEADFEEIAISKPTLTAAAKATLDRIDEYTAIGVFPVGARKAIETELFPVSVQQLEHWDTQEEEDFKKIGRLIFGHKMTYVQASRFVIRIRRAIDNSLYSEIDVNDLVSLAKSNGNSAFVFVEDFRIDVSRTKSLP